MQLPSLSVKINAGYADEKCDVHACGGGAAGGRFGRYTADGRGTEEVGRGNEVVCMPLSQDSVSYRKSEVKVAGGLPCPLALQGRA